MSHLLIFLKQFLAKTEQMTLSRNIRPHPLICNLGNSNHGNRMRLTCPLIDNEAPLPREKEKERGRDE